MENERRFLNLDLFDLFSLSLILFSFTTLTYQFWPIVNRVIGFFVIGLLVLILLINMKKRDIIVILLIVLVDLISFRQAKDFSLNLNDAVYWSISLLLLWKFSQKDFSKLLFSSLNKINKFIKIVVVFDLFILLISFLFKSSFVNSWGGSYYIGFAYSQHSLSCGCCILLAMLFFVYQTIKNDLIKVILFLIPTYAIFQSGARSYLFSIAFLWIIFFTKFIRKGIFKNCLLVSSVLIIGFFFFKSNMNDKFTFTMNNEYTSNNAAISFSSGRLEFWMIDLKEWYNLNLFDKLLGKGFDYVYEVNSIKYGLKIWAHNDIINVLLCNGVLGLSVYLFIVIHSFICLNADNRINKLLVILYLLIIIFINGLFVYQHYLYSYLLLYVLFDNIKEKEYVYEAKKDKVANNKTIGFRRVL